TSLSLQLQSGYMRTVFPLMITGLFSQAIDSGPNYLNRLTLSVQQSLLAGRSRDAARSADIAARIQVRLAEIQLARVTDRVLHQAMQAYAQLFFAEAQVVLQRRSLARTQRQIDAANQQLKAG